MVRASGQGDLWLATTCQGHTRSKGAWGKAVATQDEHRQQRKERQRKGTAAAQGTAAPVWLVLGSPSCSSAANAVPTFAINCCGPVVSRPRKRPRKRLRKRLRTDCASGTVETQRNAEKGSGERQRGSDRGRDGQQHVAADAPPPPPSPPSSSGSPPARSRGTLKSGKRLPTCHLFGRRSASPLSQVTPAHTETGG